jgi:hypothetical protein
MEQKVKEPTYDEIISFLESYGWKFRDTTNNQGQRAILSNYSLSDEKGILLTFYISGEFVIVSSYKLLENVPSSYAPRLLFLNDTLKLAKLYCVNQKEAKLEIDIGFELWAEAWNKETFFAFMDMLCLGIEKVLEVVEEEKIPHQTQFVNYKKE